MYKAAGAITDARAADVPQARQPAGRPSRRPRLPWVDVATGSLGQGLPVGVGVALAGKRLDHLPYRVWVLCGDSELAEGSIWEAFEHAGYERLDNLTAIIDVNRLGQRGETRHGWDTGRLRPPDPRVRLAHDRDRRPRRRRHRPAYAEAADTAGQPTAIIARTIKGRASPRCRTPRARTASRCPTPTRPSPNSAASATSRLTARPPARGAHRRRAAQLPDGTGPPDLPRYGSGEKVATRDRLRRGAGRARRRPRATWSCWTARSATRPRPRRSPRSIRTGSSSATSPSSRWWRPPLGMQARGWVPFASTFAAFLTRALRLRPDGRDQPGRTSSSSARTRGCPSARTARRRWAWRTWPLLRAVHGSAVLYPCDANQTAALVAEMADWPGHRLPAHHPRRRRR